MGVTKIENLHCGQVNQDSSQEVECSLGSPSVVVVDHLDLAAVEQILRRARGQICCIKILVCSLFSFSDLVVFGGDFSAQVNPPCATVTST